MKKKLIYLFLITSLLMFIIGEKSVAWLTSRAESTGNAFVIGTVGLGGTKEGSILGEFNLLNISPDEALTQSLSIKNTGTIGCKIYGIQLDEESISKLQDLGSSIRMKLTIDSKLVFDNYIGTIKDGLIVFEPVSINPKEVIDLQNEVILDIYETDNSTEGVTVDSISFEVLACQDNMPVEQISQKYRFIDSKDDINEIFSTLQDGEVIYLRPGIYEFSKGLRLDGLSNAKIIGIDDEVVFRLCGSELNSTVLTIENCRGIFISGVGLQYKYTESEEEYKKSLYKLDNIIPLSLNGQFNHIDLIQVSSYSNMLESDISKNIMDRGRDNSVRVVN